MQNLVVVGWLFPGLLLLLLVVTVAASRGGIPRNHLVGIRLPVLMRNDEAWRTGHAASVLPSSIAFVVALASCLAGLAQPLALWGSIAAFVGGVSWVFVRATHAARVA